MVGLPAFLYLIQNNLLYVAASHLDAATCQVAYQLKLLTTAFFSVALLKRHISGRRWGALGLLFLGVVAVQARSPRPLRLSGFKASCAPDKDMRSLAGRSGLAMPCRCLDGASRAGRPVIAQIATRRSKRPSSPSARVRSTRASATRRRISRRTRRSR